MGAGRKPLTEEKFKSIKILLAAKVSRNEIRKVLKLSNWTIAEANKCDTIEQYREHSRLRQEARKAKGKVDEEIVIYDNPTTSITLPDGFNTQLVRVEHKLDEMYQILAAIQEKVEFLEEHTPVSTKRWSFK